MMEGGREGGMDGGRDGWDKQLEYSNLSLSLGTDLKL